MKIPLSIAVAFLSCLVLAASAGAAVRHSVSAGESAEAKRFWTPERVADAVRRDPAFGTIPPAAGASPEGRETRHRPVNVFRPEVGKILGWDRYGGYSCTGSVIDTYSLRLVLTAAHCLYSNGVWARRQVFIPDYRNGRRPYGTFKVRAAWVSAYWVRNSFGAVGSNFDIGILVTRKTWSGERVGEVVGAIPYRTYPNRRGITDIYGYPGGSMRARTMRTCRSRTKPDWYGGRVLPGPTGMLARCNMAAGSSGGPWVSRYRHEGGNKVGIIDGLTSTGFSQKGRSYLTSPYLGRRLVSLIRSTEGG